MVGGTKSAAMKKMLVDQVREAPVIVFLSSSSSSSSSSAAAAAVPVVCQRRGSGDELSDALVLS